MALVSETHAPVAGRNDRNDTRRAGAPSGENFTKKTDAEVPEVRAGCIGRGHAGKTAIFRALGEGPVGDFFPSGLHVDVGDPKEVAHMIREAEETQRILQASGLPPTLEASRIRYYVYEGERQRVLYKMREVIGQVLTHTLPASAPESQARYDDYLKSLVNTHVLWAVVPCLPTNPSGRDRRRYSNDLRITSAYLREALRLRTMEHPVAVVLVLSKIDTLFKDADEARAALSPKVLREALGPLVHLVLKSGRVSDAMILPVTAFGFGNAVRREAGAERPGATQAEADEPFGGETIWLLKDGTPPMPYNLDTLVVWTLLFGLLNQNPRLGLKDTSEYGDLCQMLRSDLLDEERWFVPLKGRLARD